MFLLKWLHAVRAVFACQTRASAAYALLAMLCLAVMPAQAAPGGSKAELPQFLIVDYHPVSKTPAPASPGAALQFDYAYRVDVRNGGAAVGDLSAVVASTKKQFVVVQPKVQFGAVAALATVASQNTFVVRASCQFDHRLTSRTGGGSGCKMAPGDIDLGSDDNARHNFNLQFTKFLVWQMQVRSGAAPKVTATLPAGLVRQASPRISAVFEDAGSGVAPASLTLTVDGVDVARQASATATGFSYVPATPLGEGAHQVALSIADLNGVASKVNWSFQTDTVAPQISGATPRAIVTTDPQVAIGARFSDAGSGISLPSVRLTVDGIDVSAQAQVSDSGVSYKPAVKLVNGAHAVALSVADAAGNVSTQSWSFEIDQSGPVVTQLQPAHDSVLAADALPLIGATVADAIDQSGTTLVALLVDGANVSAQARFAGGVLSYTPSALLPEGNHAVKLTLRDQNGNETVSSWQFVTRTAPVITSAAPRDVILNAQAGQTVSAQYGDVGAGVDPALVKLVIDEVDVTAQAQIGADSLGFTPSVRLPQGVHIVSLTVTDKAGNSSTESWRFTVYTGMPVISAMTPQDTLLADGRPVIAASYQDGGDASIAPGIDLASVRLSVDGVDVTAQAQVSATGISYRSAAALADGLHTVLLTVADKAGTQVSATWTFLTDTATPLVGDVAPADGAVFGADALPAISASYTGTASGIDRARIRLELDGVDVTAKAQVSDSAISFAPASLKEGTHTVRLVVPNRAGTSAVRSWQFVTATAPVIASQAPAADTFLAGGATPVISASYSDLGAGIDTARVVLQLDGVDVSAKASVRADGISYQVPAALDDGSHTVYLRVLDLAGNEAQSEWRFGTATAPVITVLSPKDSALPALSRPTIAASFQDARAGIDLAGVRMVVNSDDVTAQAQVTATGISYTPAAPLPPGPYTVYLEVPNKTSASANQAWGFEVLPLDTHTVRIDTPAASQSMAQPRVDVAATAHGSLSAPESATLNGVTMSAGRAAEDGTLNFTGTAELIDGINTLEVAATFTDGSVHKTSTQVRFDAPPKVVITSPADRAMLGRANSTSPADLTGNVDRAVVIQGRLNKPVVSVMINQQAATLAADGMSFSFNNFFLHEGMNVVTAVATDANGRVGSAAIQVSVDQTAPLVTVEAPVANSVTSAASIDVRGMVNDAVESFIGAPEPAVSVSVNGVRVAAQVADRFYLAAAVPLQVGQNTLVVSAVDQFGNARTQEFKVSRIAVGSERLTRLSGNNQSAMAGVELPKPLVIVALNAAGEPIANLPVRFDVVRGTGAIAAAQGQAGTARNLKVTTDQAGRAQVWLSAGIQSGVGANVVVASADKFAEDVMFAATTVRGAVSTVSADLGINQFAEVASQPLELLSLVVRDRNTNPLPNVPVVYTIESGDAFFADVNGAVARDGGKRIVMNTDKNGVTAVRPTIGNTAGTVRIVARALKNADGDIGTPEDLTGNATFLIQAKQAKDGPASFSGYVYTDKGRPLPGVRLSVGRTALASTTDAQGRFEFENVPAGRIDLFVDGRTVNPTNDPARQQWPSLHFETYTVRGQDNQLPHPVYLPPLLTSEAKTVGGNQDVVLKIPGLEGFQMKVKANSVTFPDGSKTGTLVVSPVTADRLPMAPPAGGAQFGVPAWTVQPAGTRFDPPIEVTMPNAGANLPGDNLPIVQWDHDLGQFVPMGRVTVSEDGAFLVSDAGSGLTKAGWGGLCRYDPDKCAKNKPLECNSCQKINRSGTCPACENDKSKDGNVLPPVVSTQFEVEHEIKNKFVGIMEKLNSALSPVKVTLKVKGKSNRRKELQCCSASAAGREIKAAINVVGDAELEGKLALPLGKWLGTAIKGLDLGPVEIDIATVKVKGYLGASGGGTYDECKKAGEGTVTGAAGVTGELIVISAKVPVRESELTLDLVGGATVAYACKLRVVSISSAIGECGWHATAFAKGEVKSDTFKVTVLNFALPLAGSTHGTVDFQ